MFCQWFLLLVEVTSYELLVDTISSQNDIVKEVREKYLVEQPVHFF